MVYIRALYITFFFIFQNIVLVLYNIKRKRKGEKSLHTSKKNVRKKKNRDAINLYTIIFVALLGSQYTDYLQLSIASAIKYLILRGKLKGRVGDIVVEKGYWDE